MVKPETFRPTKKSKEIISKTEKLSNIRNRSHAINWLIERENPEKLGHPEKKGDSLEYPPNLFCEHDHRFYTKEKMLRECSGCQFKPNCSAWTNVF